ncbi:hypothetical protein ABW21_db0205330 [Orbilia brochopaga]|nr:hypothetical protein ABW21_db0205330 [Drechslerella brochopaga]
MHMAILFLFTAGHQDLYSKGRLRLTGVSNMFIPPVWNSFFRFHFLIERNLYQSCNIPKDSWASRPAYWLIVVLTQENLEPGPNTKTDVRMLWRVHACRLPSIQTLDISRGLPKTAPLE